MFVAPLLKVVSVPEFTKIAAVCVSPARGGDTAPGGGTSAMAGLVVGPGTGTLLELVHPSSTTKEPIAAAKTATRDTPISGMFLPLDSKLIVRPCRRSEFMKIDTRLRFAVTATLTMISLAAVPVRAADVNPTHRLSSALATEIAVAAIAACNKMTYNITAAVVDYDGIPQALIRGDGAGIHTVQTAQDKAFTAVTYGRATSAVGEQYKTNPSAVIMKEPRLIPGDGGLPIKIGNEVVGALGISGSPGKDEVCGNAALDQVKSKLR